MGCIQISFLGVSCFRLTFQPNQNSLVFVAHTSRLPKTMKTLGIQFDFNVNYFKISHLYKGN